MEEARRSAIDRRGRVGCRVCGMRFSSNFSLAQHLTSRHGGCNSDKSKSTAILGRADTLAVISPPVLGETDFPALSNIHAHAFSSSKTQVSSQEFNNDSQAPSHRRSKMTTFADLIDAAKASRNGVGKGSTGLHIVRHVKPATKQVPKQSAMKARSVLKRDLIPTGLRLRGSRPRRVSAIKQQVLQVRAQKNLKAAHMAHQGASMAFNKLSVECEVLLNQLREVATDLGVDKSLIDAMSGPYTESTASEHPAAGCNASLHSPSYSSSEERFEVLKRAVQLSRGQVVAAGVKLHNMQSNLLKAALDHSKIMLAPSPPLAAHIMDTEVSQNGLDKEGNINETLSAITPCQTNQPKADQILPVAEKQIDTTPETREVSIQQSHHGRPLSTIGIIPQQDETSSEEDSGDDEGNGSIPRGWTDVLSGWAGKIPGNTISNRAPYRASEDAPLNPHKDPLHDGFGKFSSFRQQGLNTLQMAVNKTVGSLLPSTNKALEPTLSTMPNTSNAEKEHNNVVAFAQKLPQVSNLQEQSNQPMQVCEPSLSGRATTWPLNAWATSPTTRRQESSHSLQLPCLKDRPRSGFNFSRWGDSGTDILGEALQRLQKFQLTQQASKQQVEIQQQDFRQNSTQHHFQPPQHTSSSPIGSNGLTHSCAMSGSPLLIRNDVYGSQLSSLTDRSMRMVVHSDQPKSDGSRNLPLFSDSDSSGPRASGLSPYQDHGSCSRPINSLLSYQDYESTGTLSKPASGQPYPELETIGLHSRPISNLSSYQDLEYMGLRSRPASNMSPYQDFDAIGSRSRPISSLSSYPDNESMGSRSRPASNTSFLTGGLLLHEAPRTTTGVIQHSILSPQGYVSIDNQQAGLDWQALQDLDNVQSQWMGMTAGSPNANSRLLNQPFSQQQIAPQDFSLQHLQLSLQQQQQHIGLMATNQATALLNAMAAAQNLSHAALIDDDVQIQNAVPIQNYVAGKLQKINVYSQQPLAPTLQSNANFKPMSIKQVATIPGPHHQSALPMFPKGTAHGTNVQADTPFICDICKVQCNSAVNLEQHIQSRKHLAKSAKIATAGVEAAARELHAASSLIDSTATSCVGPSATVHSLCKQIISVDLNILVTDLLLKVKSFQDRAIAKNAIKAASRKWYVCGLKEVRKAVKLQKAISIIIAPNIEQMEMSGGLDDHLEDILGMCHEKATPVVFALTRKRLGQVYGCRKRVSAVALLDIQGVEVLHEQMVGLMAQGCREWNERVAADGLPPACLIDESDNEPA